MINQYINQSTKNSLLFCFLPVFLISLHFCCCIFCPHLFPTVFFVFLFSLSLVFSLCVLFTVSAQVCRGPEHEGCSPVAYPAELLSPGVRMTGSQPDGTEQVCSMWPPLLRGRMQGGEEEGVKRRRRRGGGLKKGGEEMEGVETAESLIYQC